MEKSYDIAIIGGGTGGYVAAIRARQLGYTVALIEKDKLGGTCLHNGCIPTKSLLNTSNLIKTANQLSEFGISEVLNFNYEKIIDKKNKTVDTLYNGVSSLMKKHQIDVYYGHGRILGPSIFSPMAGTIAVETENDSMIIKNDYVIIATGSKPIELDFLPFDGEFVLSSKEFLSQKKLPKSVGIIGGGVIGLELASILSNLNVDVTIIEGSQNIIPNEDKLVIRTLKKHLEQSNVKIITDLKISNETVTVDDGVSIKYNDETLNFEQVIVAIGRKANIDDIGLNNTKAKFNTYIETNEFYQTADSHIYAIGDVLNTYQLAHVASKEGIIAVEHIKGLNPITLNYDTVPRCIYTNLEVGVVGPTEEQLKQKGIEYNVSVLPLQAVGKAIIENGGEGFVKLITDKDNMLLGASIVGPNATEIINELSLASFLNSSVEELYNSVHAHPSISEGIMESALLIDERGIHF